MRGVRVGNDDFYLFDYNEDRSQLIVDKSNVKNAVGRELFSCLAKRRDKKLPVTVMTKSQVNKAAKAA
jgi:hypothetical protein